MSRRSAHAFDVSQAPLERRTAEAWAKRAIRAFKRAARTGDRSALLEGEDHRHEALEHGALVSDHGRTVARLQRAMDAARDRAWRTA